MLKKEHFYRAKYTWLTFLIVMIVGVVITVAYSQSLYFILAVAFAALITGTAVSAIAATRDR